MMTCFLNCLLAYVLHTWMKIVAYAKAYLERLEILGYWTYWNFRNIGNMWNPFKICGTWKYMTLECDSKLPDVF